MDPTIDQPDEEPEPVPCSGGCGELVIPDSLGLAWCGETNCAVQAQAEARYSR